MKQKLTVKEQVLKTLEKSHGDSISGENLATELNVTRAAIWKSIESLRSDGYNIHAVTNKGYHLVDSNDLVTESNINPFLSDDCKQVSIKTYKTIDSTNTAAKQLAMDGAPAGTIVIADEQTKGKGRMGRTFFSPTTTGLYLSIILKPTFNISKSILITTAASVAVCRAIKNICNIDANIKWVNDIFIEGKKVCGILTEAVTDFESGQIDSVILGIGVNCQAPENGFPDELSHIACALSDYMEKGMVISRNQLAAEIINQVYSVLHDLTSKSFIKEYRERSIVVGKQIDVIKNGVALPGKALYIDADGALIVQFEKGAMKTLNSGEISIRL